MCQFDSGNNLLCVYLIVEITYMTVETVYEKSVGVNSYVLEDKILLLILCQFHGRNNQKSSMVYIFQYHKNNLQ